MIYLFHLIDRPGNAHIRASVRPLHKEYIGKQASNIAFAGPLMSDDGETMIGSVFAIEFADKSSATSWLSEEPFTKAGLYAECTISGFINLWPQKAGFPPIEIEVKQR